MATTASRKNTALKEAMTKSQLLDALSESTGLQRKDVASVLEQLGVVIERHVRRRAVGTFTLPGLLKIKVVRKPAGKARKMMSPFTGQEITVAAKPASRAVKVQPPEQAQAHDGVGSGPAGREHGCAVQVESAMVAPRARRGVRGRHHSIVWVRIEGSLKDGEPWRHAPRRYSAPPAFAPSAPAGMPSRATARPMHSSNSNNPNNRRGQQWA